jgi:hypothetical protein
MPSPDQLAHLAQHHHRIAVMIAIGASQIGMWICIWIALFANRKKAEDTDRSEPRSSSQILRQKSPVRPTSFSVREREDGPQ